jgi:putative methyltransferase (TIGR04325 family)
MDRVEDVIPGLRAWHRAQYRRHFTKYSQWERLFHGVYATWHEALSAIPAGRPVGYDNPETATFLGSESPMLPSEYPVLFWLASLLREETQVFDFGGYLGLSYRWGKPYGFYPANLRWTVYDVPAVVRAGEAMLLRAPDPHLAFTEHFAEAASAGVLLASGSLQFDEQPFATRLGDLSAKPRHLLINKTPLTHRHADFVASIEALGYRLIDTWKNPELGCFIAFHPEATIDAFDGFYFRREDLTLFGG